MNQKSRWLKPHPHGRISGECKVEARVGFTVLELLVAMGIVAIVIGLSLASVQRVRTAALRIECVNRMRQLGLALHAFHGAQNVLPKGINGNGRNDPYPYQSWLAQILPYVEEESLWRQMGVAYGTDRWPFNNPPHHGLDTPVKLFVCPADGRIQSPQVTQGVRVAFTSYLGVTGTESSFQDGTLFFRSSIRFADILDGMSNTLIVGERPPSFDLFDGWWYAGQGRDDRGTSDMLLGVRERNARGIGFFGCATGPYSFGPGLLTNPCDQFHFWSLHSGGTSFLFCDGSVRFLAYSADGILPALASRSGRETVVLPE